VQPVGSAVDTGDAVATVQVQTRAGGMVVGRPMDLWLLIWMVAVVAQVASHDGPRHLHSFDATRVECVQMDLLLAKYGHG
jgi:hypothetical protein